MYAIRSYYGLSTAHILQEPGLGGEIPDAAVPGQQAHGPDPAPAEMPAHERGTDGRDQIFGSRQPGREIAQRNNFV